MPHLKKFVCKISIFLPIFFLYIVMQKHPALSIRELGIYSSASFTVTIYVLIVAIWFSMPFRRDYCNGNWTELIYNLFPITTFGLLLFAQRYFVISSLLISAWLVTAVVVSRDQPDDVQFFKNLLIIGVIVSLVPTYYSTVMHDFKSPFYEAVENFNKNYTAWEAKQKPEEVNIYAENKDLLSHFLSEEWEDLTIQDRINAAQALVEMETQILGIPSIAVKAEMLEDSVMGLYIADEDCISINIKHLSSISGKELIEVLTHESYHAHQQYILRAIDWSSDVFQNALYFQEIRDWEENRKTYQVSHEKYDTYVNQPLEQGARKYAQEETKKILSYMTTA